MNKKSKMPRVKKLKFLNDPEPQKEKQNDLQSSEEEMESLVEILSVARP